MLTPFALFFGLTVATAVIAYWSDNLGKKLGKKRISLMGMRPRTTATVLTIASSWGIMLFTLIVMLVVAKPLRDALFRYDSVNQQKDTLAAQRDQLIRQKEEIEKSLDDQQKRLNRVEKRAIQAGVDLRIQTGNASKARDAARESQRKQRLAVQREAIARNGEKNAVTSERMAKRGAAAATKRAEDARKGEMAAKAQAQLASMNLGQVQLQLRQNRERLQQANNELLQTNTELEHAQYTLTIAQNKYKDAQQKLKVTNGKLLDAGRLMRIAGETATKAFNNAAAAEKEAENAKQEYLLAQQKVNVLNQQREDLEQRIKNKQDQFHMLATRPVIVAYNQTLAARTLPRGLAPARIESHLRSLFKVAQETGKGLLDNDRVNVVLVQESDNDTTKISDDEVYSRAADFIAASNREVSVRVVAISNFVQGEPVIFVRFQMVEVKKAVDAGEVLASRTIDSKIGDSAIFNLLLDLVETGRSEATRRGIKPPQSADDPNFYENGTNEQIFEALRKIEKVGGTPTVSIVATDDLSTVEPIRVRFEVS